MTRRRPATKARIPTESRLVWEPTDDGLRRRPDELAVEEPLEIRLSRPAGRSEILNVTMRTPGHDFELAAGWALSEAIVSAPAELRAVRYCTDEALDSEQRYNVVTLDLAASALPLRPPVSRLTLASSSCGVCGAASIALLNERGVATISSPTRFRLEDVVSWPELLREGQSGFEATGGLHAAGLVDSNGQLLVAREDIGRHNAVDKVIGWAMFEALGRRGSFPLSELGLVVSGRTSFEIVQKALAAGLPVVAGVSAASSLAARLADERGLTLAGFVREGRATFYCHPERISW